MNSQNSFGRNGLHEAAMYNHDKCASLVLRRNVDVRCQDNDQRTALHLSVEGQHVEVTRRILECAPDLIDIQFRNLLSKCDVLSGHRYIMGAITR